MARGGRRIDRLFYELGANVEDFQKGMDNAEKSAKRFGSIVEKYPLASAGALAAALVSVGVKAVQMSISLEHAMAKVSTQLEGGAGDVKKFREEILDLYQELPVDRVEDLTEGLYELLSAGVPASKAMETLRTAAKSAVGGMTTVGVAVDGITTALNSFSHTGITAEEIADKFFTSAKLGKTTLDEISREIGKVSGIASGLGLTLDDVLAPMTALTLRGVSTAEAFTALRSTFENILKPTVEFRREFPEIAKEFNQTKLQSVGVTQFLAELAQRIKGNDDLINKMFGSVTAFNAVLSLTSDDGKQLTGVFTDLKESAGNADQAFSDVAESTESLWKVTKNQLNVQLMRLGNVVLPLVNRALKTTVDLIDEITGAGQKRRARAAGLEMESLVGDVDALAKQANKAEQYRDAVFRVRKAVWSLLEGKGLSGSLSKDQVGTLSDEQISAAIKGLDTLVEHGNLSGARLRAAKQNILRLQTEEDLRALHSSKPPAASRPTEDPEDKKLSPEQIAELKKREEERQKVVERAREYAIRATKTLVDDLEREISLLEQEVIKKFGALAKAPAEVVAQLEGTKARLASVKVTEPLQKDMEDLKQRVEEAEEALKLGATGPSRDLLARYDELIGKTRVQLRFAKEGTDHERELQTLLRGQLSARNQLHTAILNATETSVDNLEHELAVLERLKEGYASVPAELAEQIARKKAEIATAKLTEPLQKDMEQLQVQALRAFDAFEKGNRGPLRDLITSYDNLKSRITASMQSLDKESAEYKALEAILRDVAKARKDAAGDTGKEYREKARQIEDVARSVLQLAEAFGILDARAAQALESIVQIAANVKGALKGDVASIFSAVGGVAQLLSGAFADSPAEQERKRLAKETNEALRVLSRRIGDLGLINVTGQQMAQVQRALTDPRVTAIRPSAFGAAGTDQLSRAVGAALERVGLSYKDLTEIAKELGIAIDGTRIQFEDVKNVLDAISKIELTQFVQSFQGQMLALMAQFELFDISDPVAQLRELADVMSNPNFGAPALRKALAGLDLSTPEGRRQAEAAIQQLFRQMQAGTLDFRELGGLSAQELLQAMQQIESLIDQADAMDPAGQNQNFTVNRTITEITGSRIASILTTQTVWLQQIAESMASANALLKQFIIPPGGIRPPVIPADFGYSSAPTVQINGGIQITVQGATTDNAKQIGQDIAQTLVDTINRELGKTYRQQRVQRGAILTS